MFVKRLSKVSLATKVPTLFLCCLKTTATKRMRSKWDHQHADNVCFCLVRNYSKWETSFASKVNVSRQKGLYLHSVKCKLDIIFGFRVANISAPPVRCCACQCTRACFSFLVVFTSSPPLFEMAAKHHRCILKGEQRENSQNKWRGNVE